MFSHSASWSSAPMQSSPNRSESAEHDHAAVAVLGGDDQRRTGHGCARRMCAPRRGRRCCSRSSWPGRSRRRRRRPAGHRRCRGRRRRVRRGSRSGHRRSARSPERCRCAAARPKRSSRLLRLLPYLSCSVSPSTTSPPPPLDIASIAPISLAPTAAANRSRWCAPTARRRGARSRADRSRRARDSSSG